MLYFACLRNDVLKAAMPAARMFFQSSVVQLLSDNSYITCLQLFHSHNAGVGSVEDAQ